MAYHFSNFGGDIIKKQVVLFITLIACMMLAIGVVSAQDTDTLYDSQNSLPLGNDVSDIVADADDSSAILDASSKDSADTVSVNVKVNYEYDDETKLVPDFYVVSDDKYLNFTKKLDSNNNYVLNINNFNGDKLNITAMTAGYGSEVKIINGADLNKIISFDLKASEAYKLGRTVTESADKLLDFKNADDILVVTSAGVAKLDGKTSEEAIEGIINYGNNMIAYSNVLMLRQTAVDPIDFAFIVKKGNKLNAAIFEDGSRKQSYSGTISENMTKAEWNNYFNSIKGDNAWSFASLANGWVAGVSREVLQEGAFHGHICEGTLGGYSIVQALLKYYPPVQETQPGGAGSPADITSYKILGVPGGSDDDAAMFFLDATIGKTGYVGIDTTATGATENMIGFIRWYSNTKTGDLIIMSLNSTNVKNLFTKETGIDPDKGSLEELKYCTWWINKINSNPGCLVDFLYEFTGLNEEQYYYLMGTQVDVGSGEEAIPAIDAHGLDMEYILSLNLTNAKRTNVDAIKGILTDKQMKQIGIDAANKGKALFKEELGIDINKDAVDFAVFTSAGYVYLDGQETVLVRDGLHEALGTSIYSKNMLQYHQALWKPLWFAFILRHPDSDIVHAAYIRYNSDGSFFVGQLNGSKVVDIGIETLNNSAKVNQLPKTFIPDGGWSGIQSIANAWRKNPDFDQIMSFLYHNHVCPGVQPGFFQTDLIQEKYPLGENESYIYIGSNTYCKDDSLTYLLGVSPGMGTYFVKKLPDTQHESEFIDGRAFYNGILIVWDDNLKVGKASILSYQWPTFDLSMYATSEANRYGQIDAFIDAYKGVKNPHVVTEQVISIDSEKWITEEQLNMIKTGVEESDVYQYVKGLKDVSKEDLLKAIAANKTDNTKEESQNSNSNNINSNTNSNSNRNSNTNAIPSNSNGVSQIVGSSSNVRAAISSQSSSVGENSQPLEDSSSDELSGDENSPSNEKAYEVSKSATKSADSNSLLYAILGVLAIGIVLGFGYMMRKN